jgi:hypothetical protein
MTGKIPTANGGGVESSRGKENPRSQKGSVAETRINTARVHGLYGDMILSLLTQLAAHFCPQPLLPVVASRALIYDNVVSLEPSP